MPFGLFWMHSACTNVTCGANSSSLSAEVVMVSCRSFCLDCSSAQFHPNSCRPLSSSALHSQDVPNEMLKYSETHVIAD